MKVAIVGATGAVGEEILSILEESHVQIDDLLLLASSKSVGTTYPFRGKEYSVDELKENVFKDFKADFVLFSAGSEVSRNYAEEAAKYSIVIDNTSYFRMDKDIPLVVPFVNSEELKNIPRNIVANPNCSTIELMFVLKALEEFGINRVDVSTYQAVSGAGASAIEEMMEGIKAFFSFKFEEFTPKIFSHKIAFNVIPQIDKALANGFTKEEMKMSNEARKILKSDIKVVSTCVRVPTIRGHAESVVINFKESVDEAKIKSRLEKYKHIILVDDLDINLYPTPLFASNKDDVFVGRIRKDIYDSNILHLFVVADNLRVGAALNAVRIMKECINVR